MLPRRCNGKPRRSRHFLRVRGGSEGRARACGEVADKTDFLGSSPTGYINYAPDGRMMVLNVGNGRGKPAGANATPAEAEALFRSMTSYGGTYTIEGNEITHHVDVSWNETWTGTKQKRIARFVDRVYLSTPPSPDPLTGAMSMRTMTWEKVT
jgi:hypothetical protein